MAYPPRNLWIPLPCGPKYITGYTHSATRRWILNATKLIHAQIENNGYFYLEATESDPCWSINDRDWQQILREFTSTATRDMCFDYLTTENNLPVQRPTRIHTNNAHFQRHVQQRCTGNHSKPHVDIRYFKRDYYLPRYPPQFGNRVLQLLLETEQ